MTERRTTPLMLCLSAALSAAALTSLLASPALAEPPPAASAASPRPAASSSAPPAPAQPPEEVAPDSPRAALTTFLTLTRQGRHAEAARFLELGPKRTDGADLARRLRSVLDRQVYLDIEAVSPRSEGRTNDGLPSGMEQIGTVKGPTGHDEPLRMVLRVVDGHRQWLFSASTVERINAWYGASKSGWLEDVLPPSLLVEGPFELRLWQWVALPVIVLVASLLGRLLGALGARVLGRVARRSSTWFDDAVFARLTGPRTLGWMLAIVYVLLPWLDLPVSARAGAGQVLSAGVLVVVFWALWQALSTAADGLPRSSWARSNAAASGIAAIGLRIGKMVLAGAAVLTLLARLGYSIGTIVAGLGIGGLAVALAFQKTGENLFGSIALTVDRPFRPGDLVRVNGMEGVVESVGLRSTRLRTAARTLVTIPNGKLSEMQIESLSARDRILFCCTLALPYGTTEGQLRAVLRGLEAAVREHPAVWRDEVAVRLKGLSPSGLEIDINAWFLTTDPAAFSATRQELLLKLMAVVEALAGQAGARPLRLVPAGPTPS